MRKVDDGALSTECFHIASGVFFTFGPHVLARSDPSVFPPKGLGGRGGRGMGLPLKSLKGHWSQPRTHGRAGDWPPRITFKGPFTDTRGSVGLVWNTCKFGA